MKNKVLVELVVPDIDEIYNVYLPVNRRIGNITELLKKSIYEITSGIFSDKTICNLYNVETGEKYSVNALLRDTNIRNGSRIVLL